MRGVVLKYNNEIAVKITNGNKANDFAEYSTIQYLASHSPPIPPPKRLGLIKLARCGLSS